MQVILSSFFSFALIISPPQYPSYLCKYISSNINAITSEITPCDFKDLGHFTASRCPSADIFSIEMETLSLIIGIFVKNYNVEEVNIEQHWAIMFFFS